MTMSLLWKRWLMTLFGLITAMLVISLPIVAHAETVLLDFSAPWCQPCAAMAPVIDSIEQEGYTIQRIDFDRDKTLVSQYGVSTIPCFVVVEQGREVYRIVGRTDAGSLKLKMKRKTYSPQPGREPHAAWRYERATGKYSSTVRIHCQISDKQGCLGSGVLVKWGSKIVVLTAKHVVRDARKIIVTLATGRKHNARVLMTSDWDCAVLQLDGRIEGIDPAEIAINGEDKFDESMQFTSCGFGGEDTKLAANTGNFVGYRRNKGQVENCDDWFIIRGPARQGDSGGPIFNANGRVAGILWGTAYDKETGWTVVGVQVGRVSMVLNESTQNYREQSDSTSTKLVPVVFPVMQRNPSPLQPPMEGWRPGRGGCPDGSNCQGGNCPPTSPEPSPFVAEQTDSMLPWRQGIEKNIGTINQSQAEINRKLDALLQMPPPLPPSSDPALQNALSDYQRQIADMKAERDKATEKAEKAQADNTKTLPGRIADKEAAWLVEHGGPISSRIAAKADANLDDESAAVRFKGFTQAKVALLIFCGAIVTVLLFGVLAIHKVNNKLLPKLQEAAAKTPNTFDDKLVGILSSAHGRIDDLEAKVKGSLPDMAAIRSKADAALHVATQAAIATVPGAAPIAVGISAANAAADIASAVKLTS